MIACVCEVFTFVFSLLFLSEPVKDELGTPGKSSQRSWP